MFVNAIKFILSVFQHSASKCFHVTEMLLNYWTILHNTCAVLFFLKMALTLPNHSHNGHNDSQIEWLLSITMFLTTKWIFLSINAEHGAQEKKKKSLDFELTGMTDRLHSDVEPSCNWAKENVDLFSVYIWLLYLCAHGQWSKIPGLKQTTVQMQKPRSGGGGIRVCLLPTSQDTIPGQACSWTW